MLSGTPTRSGSYGWCCQGVKKNLLPGALLLDLKICDHLKSTPNIRHGLGLIDQPPNLQDDNRVFRRAGQNPPAHPPDLLVHFVPFSWLGHLARRQRSVCLKNTERPSSIQHHNPL